MRTNRGNKVAIAVKDIGQWVILIALISLVMLSPVAAQEAGLVLGKTRIENKMLFTLNGEPFFPVIASVSISTDFSQVNVEALQDQGFNAIYTAIDFAWLEPRGVEIDHFMRVAAQASMPVIVELGEWDYWRNWLREHSDANMVMSHGASVTTFADYANPVARDEHLRRFQELSAYLSTYRNNPVVALSMGAYDYYHIPDAETHADFVVPQHATFPQTWLPYGEWAEAGYIDFLKAHSFTPAEVGFDSWEEVVPPSEWENIQTPLQWATWMWYRKDDYVLTWLTETVSVAREGSGLPVSVSLDVRPAGWDTWATPTLGWADIFDFIFVYYYGLSDQQSIHERLRYFYHAYDERDVPLISLLEFSSVIGAMTPAEDYLNASMPYASGVQFGFGGSARHEGRLEGFLSTAREIVEQDTWQVAPSPAEIGILVSSPDSYIYVGYEAAARAAHAAGLNFEAVYDLNDLSNYQLIYVPPNQILLERQPDYQALLDELREQGITVIQGVYSEFQHALGEFES